METLQDLPAPTSDLDRARRDLDVHGFCVVADALAPKTLAAVRYRVVEQAAGERALGVGDVDDADLERYIGGAGRGLGANRRVWTLVNKGAVFQELLLHTAVNELVAHLLGRPFLLSSIQANIVSPGDDALALHSDQGYVPRPWPLYPVTASAIWMLDDFTPNNGSTSVVPRTHVEHDPDPAGVLARARLIRRGGTPVCGRAGSVLVFDGRIVHGTSVNTTDRPRLGILTYFCQPFVRQQENFTLSVAPEVLAELPHEIKAMLGFEVWKTLGSVEGVCAEGSIVERQDAPLRLLNADGRPRPDLASSARDGRRA